ncbi:RimJ/RimL family protein N-acetyltransferase [Kibdelosporangium banguiense]|uniref:RimJ/RimL family protein N-acetyltransferase n=1 Tax=Kibdelosporangium banguiense TaxID=1365924 RepID=A0ABS4TCR8_9PSEU|nr:GNAT family N-acetyltransferase [Kibdelosporangium banguiense]MBP2321626.1 RimJ/RimL family protein N-acetyltransferase [Kibdelosporangium banguiense]
MDPWPLRHLLLRTPRLELRPDDDAGLLDLAEVAQRGIHPPDYMPFVVPWTDNQPHEWLQHYWLTRATLSPADWTVNFLVRLNGRVIGMQGLSAKDFAVTRAAQTGSWLGIGHQGQGYGTEMRAAVAMFAFDHLHAEQMSSGAFADNKASHAVSRKLGYRPDGTERMAVKGKLATNVRLRLTPETFVRPQWPVEVDGLDGCAELLGSGVPDR